MMSTYFVNLILLDTGVLEHLLDGLHGLPEEIHVQFLELRSSKGLGEVVATLERFDFETG